MIKITSRKKAIILDRDGTINVDPGYVYKIEDYGLLTGVIEGLNKVKDEFLFFIITNQSGIGYGYYTMDDFQKFNDYLVNDLKENGIRIEKTYVCPHSPNDLCDCRKPKIKFIKEIERNYEIDIKRSWMIGDHPSDIQLGINAKCRTIYLLTGHGKKHFEELEEKDISPNFIAKDFSEAIEHIQKQKEF